MYELTIKVGPGLVQDILGFFARGAALETGGEKLRGKASLDIDATTITGSITNSVSTRRPTPGREGRGEELTLSLGTGDARATLRSFKGNIRLIR